MKAIQPPRAYLNGNVATAVLARVRPLRLPAEASDPDLWSFHRFVPRGASVSLPTSVDPSGM